MLVHAHYLAPDCHHNNLFPYCHAKISSLFFRSIIDIKSLFLNKYDLHSFYEIFIISCYCYFYFIFIIIIIIDICEALWAILRNLEQNNMAERRENHPSKLLYAAQIEILAISSNNCVSNLFHTLSIFLAFLCFPC